MLKWLNRLYHFFDVEWMKRNMAFFIPLEDEDDLLEEEFLHMKLSPLSQDDLADLFDPDWILEPAVGLPAKDGFNLTMTTCRRTRELKTAVHHNVGSHRRPVDRLTQCFVLRKLF